MGLLNKIKGKEQGSIINNYDGAKRNDLNADWLTSNKTADEILRYQLVTLRDRSRDLARNNDYIKHYLTLMKTNVIGPQGIKIENRAQDESGKLFTKENNAINEAFKEWSHKSNASASGRFSWHDIEKLVVESVIRDGEVLVHKIKNRNVNAFGYTLQVLEGDLLDVNYNRKLANGNEIKMGIECNSFGKVINYHLLTKHPGDNSYSWNGIKYRQIQAADMLHLYIIERSTQTRGVPWCHTAIARLRMLGGYEEAELVAARVGASKMGFYEPIEGETQGKFEGDKKKEDGTKLDEVSPGTWNVVPKGYKVSTFDPNHPAGNFAPFLKAMLRGAAAGLSIGYNSLAVDLEGVNYSSLRQGAISERDFYRVIQSWVIQNLHSFVYRDWFEMSILMSAIPINASEVKKFYAPKYLPRGWQWIDPLKEVKAAIEAINEGLTSRTRVLAEKGQDFKDIVDELAAEEDYLKIKGVTLMGGNTKELDVLIEKGEKEDAETEQQKK